MGAATSTGLVDSVLDGDIQQLKALVHDHGVDANGDSNATTKDSMWNLELEEAVHTVVASELESGQHLQQLQIALELLLQARPEAWSSTAASQHSSESGNDTSATSNSAGWSACHRACATGNLAFVAFVLQHYPAQFDIQIRDCFGLFPIDLVPPELLMSAEEIADNLPEEHDRMKPGTARTRRCLALQRLRERKATLQEQQIRSLVGKSKSETTSTPSNQDEEAGDDFYVIFEPNRERLSIDQACNMGHVHEREALLRVNYRVPRTESFVNGYFQLIWRELGDARSEEPHYDERIIKLRDENAQGLNQEAPLQVQQPPDVPDAQSAPAKESSGRRSLDDRSASSVVKGCFTVDVSHLPADSVCHVLFIACDRHMLHRTIALSTEGLAVQIADIEDPDSDDYDSDSTSEEGEYQKDGVEHKQEVEPGFTFFVGGEEFSHPNSVFAGQSFPDVEAFENFLRELRVRKQRRLQEKREQLDKEAQHAQQDHTEEYQLQQQQEAGQVAEEVSNKSDDAESPGKQQEDEVRPPEKPTDTTEQDHSNQEDDDESEN
ncbi:hypothetical protein PRIC1_011531 [Phytophthora ramorum]